MPLGRTPIVLLLALALVLGSAATACTPPAAARVSQELRVQVYDSAVLVLTVLDTIEAEHLRSLEEPTMGQLVAARERVRRLRAARDSLEVVGDGLTAGTDEREKMRIALSLLRITVNEMKESGVSLPESADRALRFAERIVEGGAS